MATVNEVMLALAAIVCFEREWSLSKENIKKVLEEAERRAEYRARLKAAGQDVRGL